MHFTLMHAMITNVITYVNMYLSKIVSLSLIQITFQSCLTYFVLCPHCNYAIPLLNDA